MIHRRHQRQTKGSVKWLPKRGAIGVVTLASASLVGLWGARIARVLQGVQYQSGNWRTPEVGYFELHSAYCKTHSAKVGIGRFRCKARFGAGRTKRSFETEQGSRMRLEVSSRRRELKRGVARTQ